MIPDDFVAPLLRLAEASGAMTPLVIGVIARMSAVAFLAPGLGERATPMRVRLAAVFAMTMLVAPTLADAGAPQTVSPAALAALIGAEAMSGFIIGFSMRLVIFILQMTGTIAAQHLSMSMLFGPGIGHDQESPLSTILIMAGLAVAAAGGLHVEIAASLVRSYQLFPFGEAPLATDAAEWASRAGGEAIAIAFTLAAPFVILGFVYTLALAAMSRAMPQLMAAFVGAPAIIFAGMILIAGAASVIVSHWAGILAAVIADPVGGMR
ncbi:MAG: hypothetical protein A3E78_00305 [Alphaproteobacteria bacterium RIFCSPHIGHO2_12_FULL_63_12]|nr:MAG: hypothetical protein A3E78_00305 [Alphaproteobacteria bacterium RIFCSPHIGHO2_12_FULL_63_12]